ncbi:HNH endonuclease family protein [Brevibacterium luteolum]|nr:HNH endonuclease family protein [Brevibacterium luteolum]
MMSMSSPPSLRPSMQAGNRKRRRLWWTAFAIVVFAVIGALVDSDDDEQPGSAVPEAAPSTTAAAPAREPATAASTSATPTPSPTSTDEASPGTALAMLAELEVKGRAPKTGYDRDAFAWRQDTDANGCDTRNDVLRRDLTGITLKSTGCVVLAGSLTSPFTGETFDFIRGPGNNIDIDHLVSLSNAWQTGAQRLDASELIEFGNDPLNLLAVESSLNSQKGDGDAATWLPPAKSYRCEYVSRQIAIKHKYRLWVVPPEKEAMRRVLSDCPDEPAFTADVSWPGQREGDGIGCESPGLTGAQPLPRRAHQVPGRCRSRCSTGRWRVRSAAGCRRGSP